MSLRCPGVLTVEQPQSGFQDTAQPYQSLAVAQNGQFSPSMEGSHGSFLAGKGAGTLAGMEAPISVYFSLAGLQVCNLPTCLYPGETEQSYYSSDGQRQPPSFWPQYSSPGFTAPQPHPPLASCPSDTTEQYCPRVSKRKNSHPQRPDREGHVTAMSAYPGPILNYLCY